MNYRRYSLLIAVLAAGCGGPSLSDPNNVNQAAPTEVRGSILGNIHDVYGTAIAGATIHVQAGLTVADGTTDATGAFLVNNIPGNAEFAVTISKTGYATISQEAEKIVSAVGDEPLKDGANYYDITMYSLTQSFRIQIDNGGLAAYSLPATDKLVVQACFDLRLTPGDPSSALQYCISGKYTLKTASIGIVEFTAAPDFDELLWAGTFAATIKAEDTTGKFFPNGGTPDLIGTSGLSYLPADGTPSYHLILSPVNEIL